ncbi:hypothetical protein M9Y10_018973 [Tritrichomonas musculus]|uniref:Initiator binding domain-containing protein n=1 Tax=Tritrichomonas musculus TaxID=1915356 RepID=A0ABR2HI90_9EUKA
MTKLLSNSLHDQLELNDTDLLIQTNKSRINIDDIHFEDNGFKSSNLDFSMDSYLQEQDSRHNYQSVSYPTIDISQLLNQNIKNDENIDVLSDLPTSEPPFMNKNEQNQISLGKVILKEGSQKECSESIHTNKQNKIKQQNNIELANINIICNLNKENKSTKSNVTSDDNSSKRLDKKISNNNKSLMIDEKNNFLYEKVPNKGINKKKDNVKNGTNKKKNLKVNNTVNPTVKEKSVNRSANNSDQLKKSLVNGGMNPVTFQNQTINPFDLIHPPSIKKNEVTYFPNPSNSFSATQSILNNTPIVQPAPKQLNQDFIRNNAAINTHPINQKVNIYPKTFVPYNQKSYTNDKPPEQNIINVPHIVQKQGSFIQNNQTTQNFQQQNMINNFQKKRQYEEVDQYHQQQQNIKQIPSQKHSLFSNVQDSFESQLYYENKLFKTIEDSIRSKILYEPPLFKSAMLNPQLIINPCKLKFEPLSYWEEFSEDITFKQLVNSFFRINKSRIFKFIYKLYDMLLLTSKNPLFKGIVGVNWVTERIFSVNAESIAAMINLSGYSIEFLLFGKNQIFQSLGFKEVTPDNFYEAGLDSFPEISQPNIRLMFHVDQVFVNKEFTFYELDEIEKHYQNKKCIQNGNNSLNTRTKYPLYSKV